jgi:hypothetical protein
MKTDTEIKMAGLEILSQGLGMVEAERFISLVQRDKFDYTEWRKNLFIELSGEEISKKAMDFQKTLHKKE